MSGPRLRETVLVLTVLHHPTIGAQFFDAFAALAIEHEGLRAVQSAIVSALSEGEDVPSVEALHEALDARGLGDALARYDEQIRNVRVWQVLADAAFEDARDGWLQAARQHSRARDLRRELADAEAAVVEDGSDESYERMMRITREIADESGSEALIESFGLASGRVVRDF